MNSMNPPKGLAFSTYDIETWKGWCLLNDREIVRISAEQGTQITLAQTFIAHRRGWDKDEVEKWYKAEVTAWVIQLLSTGELTIAIQTLENANIDVITQLLTIGVEVKDRKTIKTIALYLSSCVKSTVNEFQLNISDFLDHWRLLHSLECFLINELQFKIIIIENGLVKIKTITLEEIKEFTVQEIQKKSKKWKSKVAARVYFISPDPDVIVFLDAESSWEELLQSNNIKCLKTWLFIFFKKSKTLDIKMSVAEVYNELFYSWNITDAMASLIADFPCMDFTREEIIDYMATFGYFIETERNNVILLLKRLYRNKTTNCIGDIFKQKSSNISLDQFYKLLIEYCESNNLKTVLTQCIYSHFFSSTYIHDLNAINKKEWIDMSLTFLDLIKNPNDETKLLSCINTATKYFAGEDLDQYLIDNPIIFMGTLLFKNKSIDVEDLNNSMSLKVIEKLPHLNNFLQTYNNRNSKNINCDVSLEDLIAQYHGINISSIIEHEDLSFDNEFLMMNFGHKAILTFEYYIKIGAPFIALQTFYQKYKHSTYSSSDIKNTILNIILTNLENAGVICSCIAFMIAAKINYDDIKYYLNAARLIKMAYDKSRHQETKLQIDYSKIKILLQIISQEKKDEQILLLLENMFMNYSNHSFLDILIQWKMIFDICSELDAKYPLSFVIFCAENNKWAWFILFVTIFACSNKHVHNAISYFNETALKEHFFAALEKNNGQQGFIKHDIDVINCKNIWKILQYAHDSNNSCSTLLNICRNNKGNPTLAAVASFYKPENEVLCWYVWLSTAVLYPDNINDALIITVKDVSTLIEFCVQEGFLPELEESLLIFFPASCFTFFINIIVKVVVKNKLDCSITDSLIEFKQQSMNLHVKPNLNINNIFQDRIWIINKAIRLCCIVISYNLRSFLDIKKFLECLCNAKLTKNVEMNVGFDYILNVLQCINNTNTNIQISLITLTNCEEIKKQEYDSCLKQLVAGHYFEAALKFTEITNIDADDVVIAHLIHKCHTLLDHVATDINYWSDCKKIFADFRLISTNAAESFLNYVDNLEIPKFKYVLYRLILLWKNSSKYTLRNVNEIEKKMWLNYIYIENPDDILYLTESIELSDTPIILHHSIEELKVKACIDNLIVSDHNLTKNQAKNLFNLISKLLDIGDFVTALRVQMMFTFLHSELQLLITIMALAESSLSPYQMTAAQRNKLLQSKCMRSACGQFGKRTLKSKLLYNNTLCTTSANVNFDNTMFFDYIEFPSREKQDTLYTIEALAARLKAGHFTGQRVVLCYRAAMYMDKEYLDIIRHTDPLKLLDDIIAGSYANKLEVVCDIISANGFTSIQIADFLVYEIFKAVVLSSKNKLKRDSLNSNVTMLWGHNLTADFHLFLELCPNASDVGNSLLEYQSFIMQLANTTVKKKDKKDFCDFQLKITKVLDKDRKLTIIEIYAICVDIIIYAHNSFTRDCNIEGISLILFRARSLCCQLLQTKSWGLMVKMLTGISRYAEMTYIFEIIKFNHQFEFLLSQFNYILIKDDSNNHVLKMALLEFLKTCWPQDSELKRLVALHFQMHSEVAELLKIEATDTIKRLINVASLDMINNEIIQKDTKFQSFIMLRNTVDTRDCLFRAMNTFCHSAEYYVQQNKLSLAMNATHEAELVALQIDLLNQASATGKDQGVICVLQLNSEQIVHVIEKLSFLQGVILQRAYDYNVNWVNVLYQHCIINGDMQYLKTYNKYFRITENMATELAMKFQKETRITKGMITSLRSVIGSFKSLTDRYRLASLLGQRDIVENILSSESACFLKDTIFVGKS